MDNDSNDFKDADDGDDDDTNGTDNEYVDVSVNEYAILRYSNKFKVTKRWFLNSWSVCSIWFESVNVRDGLQF